MGMELKDSESVSWLDSSMCLAWVGVRRGRFIARSRVFLGLLARETRIQHRAAVKGEGDRGTEGRRREPRLAGSAHPPLQGTQISSREDGPEDVSVPAGAWQDPVIVDPILLQARFFMDPNC